MAPGRPSPRWLGAGAAAFLVFLVCLLLLLDRGPGSADPTPSFGPSSRPGVSADAEVVRAVRLANQATTGLIGLDGAGRAAWLSGFALDPAAVEQQADGWVDSVVRAAPGGSRLSVQTVGQRVLERTASTGMLRVALWQRVESSAGTPREAWLLTYVSVQQTDDGWLLRSIDGIGKGPRYDPQWAAVYAPVP